MKLKTVNLQTEILGYGPAMDLEKEGHGVLQSQQVVALSSMMTYKKENAKEMAVEILESQSEEELNEKILKSLINSAGRGHASLTTSAGIWVLFTGASKFVDSLFTSTIFSSSLMPSGRRIGVGLENIIAPSSIANAGEAIKKRYYETSANNIKLYTELLEKKIPKDEASKITQYGMDGGGFIFMPLETILGCKEEFESEKKWVPDEGLEFIRQIEGKVKDMGMDILYWARNSAPRNTYPSPNMFKNPERKSIISDFEFRHRMPEVSFNSLNPEFPLQKILRNELQALYSKTQEIFKDPEQVKTRWRELLRDRRNISKEFQHALSYDIFSNIPWRVWGELKRHRTVPQQVESIYTAANRAIEEFRKYEGDIIKGDLDNHDLGNTENLGMVFSMPPHIKENKELKQKWLSAALQSFKTYYFLVENNIPEKDAIAVIPRGLKLHVYKNYDLFNLLDGYLPVRLCGTAEEEMRRSTREEHQMILSQAPEYSGLEENLTAKCGAVGFCPEPWKRCCHKIDKYVGFEYTKEFHEEIHKKNREEIYDKLGQ